MDFCLLGSAGPLYSSLGHHGFQHRLRASQGDAYYFGLRQFGGADWVSENQTHEVSFEPSDGGQKAHRGRSVHHGDDHCAILETSNRLSGQHQKNLDQLPERPSLFTKP